MYKKGEGTKKNLVLALMWLDIASYKKNNFAKKMRKNIKNIMNPSEIEKSLELSSKWNKKNNTLSCNKK